MRAVNKIRNTVVSTNAPPSKAHTLRALIISSLAQGKSTIRNPLLGQDQLNVLDCLKALGVESRCEKGRITVYGANGRYSPSGEELNVGESGVGMNFLTSAACLAGKPVIITGAKRITERPIAEVVKGLRQLGGRIEFLQNEGFPPIKVYGGGIEGGTAKMKGGKTSQYFSSIVISSPYAARPVTLICTDTMTERPYFDISLDMMSQFGVKAENDGYEEIQIPNERRYAGRQIDIEGDYSSAAFFFLAAAICKAKVTVTGLNPDSKQGDRAFLDLLGQMGCKPVYADDGISLQGGELRAIEADMSNLPDLVPPMAIAAAFAQGTSRFTNIGHLRHKECDRLAVMASQLERMGVRAECDENSLTIEGCEEIHGSRIDPHNDHRIAMSFAVAGLAVGGQVIEDEMCVAKSFPDFWEKFEVFSK